MYLTTLHECTNPTVLIGKIPVSDTYVTYLRNKIKTTPDGVLRKVQKKALTICERYARIPIIVPCGKCVQCCLRKQNEWNTRIMAEKDANEWSLFITLTINPKHYPIFVNKETGEEIDKMTTNLAKNVYYPYVQKFFKRLRKFGLKFRYYCCAEYGSDFGRLHFHVIFFFTQPKSEVQVLLNSFLSWRTDLSVRPYLINSSPKKKRRKPRLQTYFEAELSTLLSDKYEIGFVEKVQECNAETARYVTKYVCKSQADEEHDKCPFHRQSLGLGTQWLYENKKLIGREEIAPIMPNNVRGDFTYFCPIPKYYRTKFIKAYGNYLQRCINLVNTHDDTYELQIHSTPVRYPDLYNFKLDSDYGIYKADINPRFKQQTKPTCFSGMDETPVTDEFSKDRFEGLSPDFSENSVARKFGMVGLDHIVSEWSVRVTDYTRKLRHQAETRNIEVHSGDFQPSLFNQDNVE